MPKGFPVGGGGGGAVEKEIYRQIWSKIFIAYELIIFSSPPGAYSRGAYLQLWFLRWGLFEGGGLIEDLRYVYSPVVLVIYAVVSVSTLSGQFVNLSMCIVNCRIVCGD